MKKIIHIDDTRDIEVTYNKVEMSNFDARYNINYCSGFQYFIICVMFRNKDVTSFVKNKHYCLIIEKLD